MKFSLYLPVLALMLTVNCASAQKTVSGLKFSACLNKNDLSADFYKGKFLVLDFWATWCGPCIGSFPALSALQKKYSGNPKVVFAAITPEPKGFVDTFFHRKKNMMPGVWHLVDDSGATWTYFETNQIPNLLVFAPSGKIVFSGRVEELAKCMDRLLKGANLYQEERKPKPVKDNWAEIKQNASFIAIAGPADSLDEAETSSNYNSDFSVVNLRIGKEKLIDVVTSIGKLTSLAVKTNDSVKANQLIYVYYKQLKNNYPLFDSGIFRYQYQNHILDMLEKLYSFHSHWAFDEVTAYKIVVRDKVQLDKSLTLSTHGSFMSTIDSKKRLYKFVNLKLKDLASSAEDYLNLPFLADNIPGGYDFDVDFASLATFTTWLKINGLALEKSEGYKMKRLYIDFY